MFDVFYSGVSPNLFAHERLAQNIEQARSLTTTRYFWWVDNSCDYSQFDFSFVPPPWQAEYTHVWPSPWSDFLAIYLVPNCAGELHYHYHTQVIPAKQDQTRFVKLISCDFDLNWAPHPWDPPYIYVFGNQWHRAEVMPTVEYHVPGATEKKYMNHPRASLHADSSRWTIPNGIVDVDLSWVPDPGSPPYIYQFGTQWQPTGGPQYHVPGATDIKYVSMPKITKITVDNNWHVPKGIDLDDFDYTWHPDDRDPPYIYQFGTQWQKTGGPQYHVPGATDIKYVEQVKITVRKQTGIAYVIDHNDGHVDTVIAQLNNVLTVVKTVRFFENYLDTLKRIANSATEEFVWIVSSVCDYTDFDFSWHPETWQATMLHVFASDDQKFGDTFFMHVPSFQNCINRVELLDWYDLNFCPDQKVPRRPWPVIKYSGTSLVPQIKNYNFQTSYVLFCHDSHDSTQVKHTASVWSKKHRELVSFSAGNSTALVPKDVKMHLETQVYDYPYIKPSVVQLSETPQDIVFISYDELNADNNYADLCQRFPRARRVHGVEGMVNALVQAANQSTTDWYYAVFAKTQVHEDFKFDFAPDRFQQPKHYIFHAINVVNDLVYGEMGIILYNRQMVLDGPAQLGIDYTMSFPNETIPIVSAWGRFNTSAYQTWRTAFRETAKLCLFDHQRPTVENTYRLNTWLTRAHGDHAEWALRGAQDGQDFFVKCKGDEQQMKHMFSWQWLREQFELAYGKSL